MSSAQHREIFYAFHGPGPYECYLCGEEVLAWWDREPDTERSTSSLAIHHIDEDHDNNCPENLTATHYGCHMKLHRAIRPLVTKGSTLPERWRQRISVGTTRRMQNMTVDERARWNERMREGFQRVDKTPFICTCGAGPFLGRHGLGIHQSRSKCQILTEEVRLKRQVDAIIEAGCQPVMCECGAGPFKSQRGLDIHRYHGRRSSRCVL